VVVGGDPAIGTPTVTIDQFEGARLATRHLLDLGHRTVHHVAGPQSWIDATARMRGWSEALRTYPAERGASVAGDWGARKGYDAAARLARDPNVTAIFAANDQTALGVIRGLHDAGRRVPEDVSVVGFDATPESGYFLPPLTTIRQDFGEVGRRSVELLLTLLDGRPDERHIVVPSVLVPRASTAPPP
jgi:DNA-binding LacI/PurR family transcriptional regulator